MRLTQIIESLLFASDAPLAAADLARVDERLDEDTVAAVIEELRREYEESERSFQIYEVGGGYQLLTRPEYAVVLEQWETVPHTTRLSLPALEVLAIIAYRQPLGRTEIEEIRGVQSAAVLRTLQDRDLIEPVGRAEGLGRPLLYGTTRRFLEHFGFRSLEDLPRPDDLPVVLRDRPPETTAGEETEPAALEHGGVAEPAPVDAGAAEHTSPEVTAAAVEAAVEDARRDEEMDLERALELELAGAAETSEDAAQELAEAGQEPAGDAEQEPAASREG
jgi:segregation and condensation protein B